MRKNYKLTIFCCFGGCLVQAMVINYLPLLFVVPTVGLMGCWDLIREDLLQIAILIVVTTILTFGVSGMLTKLFYKDGDGHD